MKRLGMGMATVGVLCTAHAAIAPPSTGNGELFFNVVDSTAKISYVLDLGMFMGLGLGSNASDAGQFLVLAQQEVGYQRFWTVDSPEWQAFLQLVNPASLRWSVLAGDSTGPLAAGTHRLLTTVKQGFESAVKNLTNSQLTNGIGSTQGSQIFGTVNAKATHAPQTDYAINGNSYSLSTDTGFGYYGKSGGLTPTLNGNAPFDATNLVGQSSWFYYLLRSGSANGNKVTIDEVDNLGSDGYWGFVKVEDQDSTSPFYNPTSPYAGKYLLSFTMPVFDVRTTAVFQSFALGIGRTEFSGGLQVSALDGAAAAAATEQAAGWVTLLGAAPDAQHGFARLGMAPVSSVPEPGSWALMLAGVAWLASRGRRSHSGHSGIRTA